ncbi:hypothetical protein ACO0QE_004440 [Hanseniaspora vineae]
MDKDTLIESDIPQPGSQPAYSPPNYSTNTNTQNTANPINNDTFASNIIPDTIDYDVSAHSERGTLDESVWDTIKRDLYTIHKRLNVIVYPKFVQSYITVQASELEQNGTQTGGIGEAGTNDSDLWAPLIFILLFSEIASSSSTSFSIYFVTSWLVILLGSIHLKKFSMLQSSSSPTSLSTKRILMNVSLLGYCIFPILLDAIIIKLVFNLLLFRYINIPALKIIIKLALISSTTFWSYYCCLVSITTESSSIEFLHKLPLLLVFTFLNWLNMI